ncbi:MAG: acetylxylan esterase [Dysgonamonadaceae bacterium]|nr:acetylxylan esterase [Dysgonamonadaceae bacterium]
MKNTKYFICLLLFSLFFVNVVCAETFSIKITPQNQNWSYKLEEKVEFLITITEKNQSNSNFTIQYEIGPEKMPPTIRSSRNVKSGLIKIDGGTLGYPGFLRCKVSVSKGDEVYTEIATAAFTPESIESTSELPADFEDFWNELKSLHEIIPLDLKLTPIEAKSTDKTTYYHVDYQNYEYGNRSYGILTVPKKEGRYPAVIRFPGAGIHPSGGNSIISEKDIITLDVYIHPFPANMENEFYNQLGNTILPSYMFFGIQDKYTYYFRRVISGCLRAIDVIYSLPQYDGENLAAWGSSQGGALSIITTSLDKRIKMLVALCPAMCDFTGYLNNRAGGWPHFFNQENRSKYQNSKSIKALSYYDVVNFARQITVPGFYSWGYNDETTPPTSIYSAFNVIDAPKNKFIIPEGKHKIYPEQVNKTYTWILESFGIK